MGDRCPDRQLLSIYFDGELPSPWKETMERHLNGCPSCAQQINEFNRLRRSLSDSPSEAAIGAAQDRVWQQLGLGTRKGARVMRFGGLWQRRISIPLPAAAAAAVLLVALAVFFAIRTPVPAAMPLMAFETPGIIPVSDMEDVLQYLGSRDNSDVVIIRLPESRDFVSYGEPAIIKAADYNRRTPGVRRP